MTWRHYLKHDWQTTEIIGLDADGNEIRMYKQMALFTVGEYKQTIEYCRSRGRYWKRLEKFLVTKARDTFGKQAELFG